LRDYDTDHGAARRKKSALSDFSNSVEGGNKPGQWRSKAKPPTPLRWPWTLLLNSQEFCIHPVRAVSRHAQKL